MSNPARFIVALDLPTAERAVRTGKQLAPFVDGFFVGAGLLFSAGPAVVAALADLGKPVVVDAAFYGSPEQIERAVGRVADYGARWVTVAGVGGGTVLTAAVAAAGRRMGVIALTVPPHLDTASLTAIGFGSSRGRVVSKVLQAAAAAGCEGAMCAATELGVLAEVAPTLCAFVPADRNAFPGLVQRGADYLIMESGVFDGNEPADVVTGLRARAGLGAPDRVPPPDVEGGPCPPS